MTVFKTNIKKKTVLQKPMTVLSIYLYYDKSTVSFF